MKMRATTAAAVAAGTSLLLCLVLGASVLGTYNSTISQEEGITATYRDSMLRYDQFWKTVSEAAQVPEKYKEDFREVMLAEVDARYEGKDPMMLFVQEKGASLDPGLYHKVQDLIEVGRESFTASQQVLNDRQRRYRTHLRTFPNNVILAQFDLPSELCVAGVDCGDFDPHADVDGDGKITVLDYKIVTSARTQQVFETGQENEPIFLFGK